MTHASKLSGPGFHVVYEDEDVLVAHKGPDILSVPNQPGDDALPARILKKLRARDGQLAELQPVHRLDRNVSGLLLFAKNEPARAALVEQFREGIPSRHYLAVVEGKLKDPDGMVRKDLDTRGQLSRAVGRGKGVPAVTRYRVKRYGPGCTLLEIELETGRKHQIRAHMAAIGHPILGDRDFDAKETQGFDRRRIALHAYRLSFKQPSTGQHLDIDDDPPATFERPFGEYDRGKSAPQPRRPKQKKVVGKKRR